MKELLEHFNRLAMPAYNFIDRNLHAIIPLLIGAIIGYNLLRINLEWQV